MKRALLVLTLCSGVSLMLIVTLFGALVICAVALMTWSNLADVYDSLDYTTRCPDKADIVGIWEPTEDTLRAMAREGIPVSRHQLILHADDTIEMRDIPGNWRSKGERMGEPVGWRGSWTLDAIDSSCSISLVDHERNWACGGCLLLRGQDPPYKAGLVWGIAEPQKRMEFRRVSGDPRESRIDHSVTPDPLSASRGRS